ncbi:hypothetical protein [Nodosilinea sp. FACHB-13]|uniref:hypothetical protein n=1 Tax=Cyanophyceae TaxID=3028117 RepID=UPI001683A117|nr:hypothetical protein [Nodosilinea sp. FACHB-13]MBD2106726.1 hypothetical protein [Nodosilinea sp. FACHB-13]
MTVEEMAKIIATGDVPLSIRMRQDDADEIGVRVALDMRQSGRYDGMNYEQVLAHLNRQRAETDAAD